VQKIREQPHSNRVTALFADRELSFVLPKGATLEDLAARLTSLRAGTPVAINVSFDS
jgi:prepilin-type processing-associated H-X9-DG protein